VDPAPSQTAPAALLAASASSETGVPDRLIEELWQAVGAESCDLTRQEFASILSTIGVKYNHGQPPATTADLQQKTAFYRSLRLPELTLAQACALGREAAWQRFLAQFRAPILQSAIAVSGSATIGHDLADSLYADLFGLKQDDAHRVSPLASYSGRGSLLGWLRTTIAQRHIDHLRRTRRESPLDDLDLPAAQSAATAPQAEIDRLARAISSTLQTLDSEDRFLLSSYFLNRRTLLEIARLLRVHEATISRRLKRLTTDLRKQLLRNLQLGGLNRRAAEEALAADPRDIDINLRSLLQASQPTPFNDQTRDASPETR
jgi:RNA polymerase sigma-70 factor (ECF subfamily)